MATRAKVNPRTSNPTHTLSLSDGVQNWGLRLQGDYKYIQEVPQTPSTLMINQQGGEYGDFDPSMSHIQQSEWYGGRASERFVEDNSRFYDSKNAWTTSTGMTHPALQWRYAIGDYLAQNAIQLGKNYVWKSLSNIYYAVQFTASSSYSLSNIQLWLRKIGNPNDLTVKITSNSSNLPSTVLATKTITASNITNNDVSLYTTSLASPLSITSGTKYFIVVSGSSSDTINNHWEIMTANGSSTDPYSYHSSDGTSWTSDTHNIYYRTTVAITDKKWQFFQLQGKFYGVIINSNKLYEIATSTDTFPQKSYDDMKLTEVTGHGLNHITNVLVANNIAYFSQGSGYNLRRWKPDEASTKWYDDGTNKSDMLVLHTTTSNGEVIYRYYNDTSGKIKAVSSAQIKEWGNSSTYLDFSSSVKLAKGTTITNMVSYQGKFYIFKYDAVWSVDADGNIYKFNSRIDDAADATNGRAAIEQGQYLYFTTDKSLEQLYGSSVTDVGPQHGAGLPSDRTGYIVALESAFNQLFVAIDGGTTNYSTIMVFDGVNYHEIWRAPEKGKSISTLYWYSNKSMAYPFLFFDYGGQICFIKYPDFGFNPTKDSGIYYVPEADIITATFDMNIVRRPKYFNEISAVSKNLQSSRSDFDISELITSDSRIEVYYQVDNDINTDNWVSAGSIFTSPFGSVNINKSNVYSIRLKFKMLVSDSNKPPIINATVLEGIARSPIKYQWVMRIKTSSMQNTLNGAPDHNPYKLYNWLKEKAINAEVVTLHSTLKDLDQKKVFIEPPSRQLEFVDPVQKSWGGIITVVFREA